MDKSLDAVNEQKKWKKYGMSLIKHLFELVNINKILKLFRVEFFFIMMSLFFVDL